MHPCSLLGALTKSPMGGPPFLLNISVALSLRLFYYSCYSVFSEESWYGSVILHMGFGARQNRVSILILLVPGYVIIWGKMHQFSEPQSQHL